MKTIITTGCAVLISLTCFLGLTGCGGGGGDGNSSSNTGGNGSQTNTPTSLAGKTYSFTVTANQGLNEPAGSTYTIVFHDASSLTFNPSPQNTEHATPANGQYTFDANTGTVQMTGVGEPLTGTFHFNTPTSGTVHWVEADGEMQDAAFTQL